MRVTIKDIAREAGVSVSTVSYALRKKGKINKPSHKRVWEVAERLHYVPDPTARSLVGGRTNSIGVVLPPTPSMDFNNPYLIQVLSNLSTILSRRKFWMSLYMPEKLEDSLMRDFLTNAKIDGLIWFFYYPSQSMCKVLHSRSLPYITLTYGRTMRGDTSTIMLDDFNGIHQAVDYLTTLGHSDILFISGLGSPGGMDNRTSAYLERMKKHCLEPRLIYGRYNERNAYEVLLDFWKNTDWRPTAVLAASDTMALGAMKALQEMGISIPGQVSVMGFDDIPAAAQAIPPLTTMAQPLPLMINRACSYLFDSIEQDEITEPAHIPILSELVIRESTGLVAVP